MVVLATCKNEEVPVKNEAASVVTTLYSYIFDNIMHVSGL